MTVVQRTPDVGIRIRMQRTPAPVPQAPAEVPPVVYGAPYWHAAADYLEASEPVTHLDVTTDVRFSPDYTYPVGVWAALAQGGADVQWSVLFTPVITMSGNNADPAADAHEVWRGTQVSLTPGPAPEVGWHPYPPVLVPIPATISLPDAELTVLDYWLGAELWRWVIFNEDQTEMACPTVTVANGVLVLCTNGRCMSGELVATASHGGEVLGQVSMNLIAINPITSGEPE